MSTPVLYDEASGVYKTDYKYDGPTNCSFYDRVLGDVGWEENAPLYMECNTKRRTLTNSALKLQAQQLGVGLIKKVGLKPGDVIMMVSGNTIEFPIILLAAAFAGLKIALANPAYLPHELKHVISVTKPMKIFIKTPLLKNLVAAKVPWHQLITIDTEMGLGGSLYMKNLMVSPEEAKQAKAYQPKDFNETQFLPFSSGTTGLPKSVEVTQRNLVAMMDSIMHIPNSINTTKKFLAILPFYHAFALLMNVLIPVIARAQVWIISPPFNPIKYCEIVEKEKIDCLCVVPPLFIALVNCPQANEKTFASVKFVITGAAPLDADTQWKLINKAKVDVRSGWGMTETTVGGLGMHADFKIGTCGKPLPGIEAKCVDIETGQPVKRFERGELWVRGPNIVKGYFQNEQANKDTFTEDRWLKTGDVAMVDDQGNFSIVDRIKELIKVKGYQVAPAELEGLLLTHPQVASAAVIGIYDKEVGTEWPRAYIELKGGRKEKSKEEEIAKDITSFIKKKTSPQKQLKGGVRFLDKIPASPSGKLLRKDLRALVKQEEASLSAKL